MKWYFHGCRRPIPKLSCVAMVEALYYGISRSCIPLLSPTASLSFTFISYSLNPFLTPPTTFSHFFPLLLSLYTIDATIVVIINFPLITCPIHLHASSCSHPKVFSSRWSEPNSCSLSTWFIHSIIHPYLMASILFLSFLAVIYFHIFITYGCIKISTLHCVFSRFTSQNTSTSWSSPDSYCCIIVCF